jgi:type IV secretory pathway VirB2 component (pilin)
MPKFATLEKIFLLLFAIIIILSLCLSLILGIKDIALALLIANFVVAGIVAVFGSLRVRDEEEDKLFK